MKLFVCAVVCASALVLRAEVVFAQDVEGGFRIGLTSSTLLVEGLPGFETERASGLLAGAWVSVSAGRPAVRLQPEIVFTTRKFSAPTPGGAIDVASRTIDVPVLIVARLRPDASARPMLFGGPYFGFVSKVTQTVAGVETDISAQIKDADAGVVLGGGVQFDAGRGAIVLDARFSLGLRNLSEAEAITFKSRTVMVSFGYQF